MKLQLAPIELRIIGCLIEKSLTTPDQYPLSLNALALACNQKTNRDPVLSLTETEVQNGVDSLIAKNLVVLHGSRSSRVAKYLHRFCNTEFSALQFSEQEVGVLCLLFLRGPQTAGELRTRSARLCTFDNVEQTEQVLQELIDAPRGALVEQLPREPGKRECRYRHCFAENSEQDTELDSPAYSVSAVQSGGENVSSSEDLLNRVLMLEETVALMQMEIDELREKSIG